MSHHENSLNAKSEFEHLSNQIDSHQDNQDNSMVEIIQNEKDNSDRNLDNEQNDELKRSIYVVNVDYGTIPKELQDHFAVCGRVNRVTIMTDKHTGHPKGYAFIEFNTIEAAEKAIELNGSIFRNRPLRIAFKRKNIMGYNDQRKVKKIPNHTYDPSQVVHRERNRLHARDREINPY